MGTKHRKFEELDRSTKDTITRHFKSLGCSSAEEYLKWCKKNGFIATVDQKGYGDLKKELAHQSRQAVKTVLATKTPRSPKALIEEAAQGSLKGETPLSFALIDAMREVLESKKGFAYFLSHIEHVSDLVTHERPYPNSPTYLVLLARAYSRFRDFQRDPMTWEPKTHNVHRQYAELLRHLFAKYPIPAFMDSVWREQDRPTNRYEWYIKIGRGESVRSLDLPVTLTKKQAHFMMQAPDNLNILQAARFGQLLSMDADSRLCTAVLQSRLGQGDCLLFKNDEFWLGLVQMFTQNPMLDRSQFGPFFDYIYNQKFVGDPPPQPNLSMKGRTPDSMMKQVLDWHAELNRQNRANARLNRGPYGYRNVPASWKSCGIGAWEKEEGIKGKLSHKTWLVREFTTSAALFDEGRSMRHCVGSYASSCAEGRIAIFGMTVKDFQGHWRALTIEVNLGTRTIVQARGIANRMPTEKEREIMTQWARKFNLIVGI